MSSADEASVCPLKLSAEPQPRDPLASLRLWTRQRSPDWRPRRASVATCQQTARLEVHKQHQARLQGSSRQARSRSQEGHEQLERPDAATCCSADQAWPIEGATSDPERRRRSLIYSMALRQLACQASWLSCGQRDEVQANCSCCYLGCPRTFAHAQRESTRVRSINGTDWSSQPSSDDRLTSYLASSLSCCYCCTRAATELGSSASLARLAGERRASLTVLATNTLHRPLAQCRSRPSVDHYLQQSADCSAWLSQSAALGSSTSRLDQTQADEEKMLAGSATPARTKSRPNERISEPSFSSKPECSTGRLEQQAVLSGSQDLNLESLIIESWLDDHPSFVRDYFMRKADNQLIDSWLVSQAKVRSNVRSSSLGQPINRSSLSRHQEVSEPLDICGSEARSAPVRKISATDFESRTGSCILRPIVSTTPDGRPTFLAQTLEPSPSLSPQTVTDVEQQQQQPQEQQDMKCNEVRLVFDLVKNICDDLDIGTLLHKILKNIAILINADKSSLFLVCGRAGDPNRHLMSQLFNVDQSGNSEPASSPIIIPWGVGLVGYVAESGESVNIANCYEDPRFTNTIDQQTGYTTKHMLCAPIYDKRNEIVGVAQVINKRDGQAFSLDDEIKFKQYLQFCGIGLRNAQSYESCQLENKRNQVLLDLARMVFEEQSTIEQVVHRIMLHIQSLLECQRCQVLLLDDGSGLEYQERLLSSKGLGDKSASEQRLSSSNTRASIIGNERAKPEWRPHCSAKLESQSSPTSQLTPRSSSGQKLDADIVDSAHDDGLSTSKPACGQPDTFEAPRVFSLVFNLDSDSDNAFMMHHHQGAAESPLLESDKHPFPVNINLTSLVARTGETLNIEDAHQDPRFDPAIDEGSSFKHKSILCMPIRDGHGRIIGVSQLINKKDGRTFNKNDENLFEAFAIFCGLGIHNTLMYERVLKIMAKQRVTFEVLSYHASAPLEEAKRLQAEKVPSCFALNLASLRFNDFSLDEQLMLKSCLRFFLDLDLMRRFQIDRLVFCRWILSVQKNYRKVTYHPVVGKCKHSHRTVTNSLAFSVH